MTVPKTICAKTYIGDGNTRAYDADFPFLDKSHVVVSAVQADGTIVVFRQGVDYQATLTVDAGNEPLSAAIALTNPLPKGWEMTIQRIVPITQESVHENPHGLQPKQVEQIADKLTMICQQLAYRFDGMSLDRVWEALAEMDAIKADASALAAEVAARIAGDKAATGYTDAQVTALTTTMNTRFAEVAAAMTLLVTRADFAAYKQEVEARFAAERAVTNAALAEKQPVAPEGGPFLGSSGGWVEWSAQEGDPFELLADGRVVRIHRLAYLPNALWDIGEDKVARLKQNSRQGDQDSVFINIDGRRVVIKANIQ